MFMLSGWVTDGLVPEPWVALAYAALSPDIEAYFWAKLSLHIPVPTSPSGSCAGRTSSSWLLSAAKHGIRCV